MTTVTFSYANDYKTQREQYLASSTRNYAFLVYLNVSTSMISFSNELILYRKKSEVFGQWKT